MEKTKPKKVKLLNKTKNKIPYNYRKIKYGKRTFKTASKAAIFLLKSTKYSQSKIARLLGVSQPCVNQLARDIK